MPVFLLKVSDEVDESNRRSKMNRNEAFRDSSSHDEWALFTMYLGTNNSSDMKVSITMKSDLQEENEIMHKF